MKTRLSFIIPHIEKSHGVISHDPGDQSHVRRWPIPTAKVASNNTGTVLRPASKLSQYNK